MLCVMAVGAMAQTAKMVPASEIQKTWVVTGDRTKALWPAPKPVDTSMYKDATDGVAAVITASHAGCIDKEMPAALFDNDKNTKYCTHFPTPWIQYQFPADVKPQICAYSLRTANDAASRDPKAWTLSGSNDGVNWTEIDSRKNVKWFQRYELKLFKLKNPVQYTTYRLTIKANNGDAKDFQISEMELFVNK